MPMQIKYLWPLAVALLVTAPAHAQKETREQKIDRHFSLLDTDGDGKIDKTEASAHPPLARHFRAMDKNKDGSLSKYELTSYRTTPRNRSLATAETDPNKLKQTGRTE